MAVASLGTFKVLIIDAEKRIFEGNVSSLFIQGDTGEFELMSYHYSVLSLLKQGQVIMDWKYFIDVRKGILKFFKNDCVIIVELDE